MPSKSCTKSKAPEVDGTVYEIEQTLKSRTRKGVTEVFVKWAGYGDEHNSWVVEGEVLEDVKPSTFNTLKRTPKTTKSPSTSARTSKKRDATSQKQLDGFFPKSKKAKTTTKGAVKEVKPAVAAVDATPAPQKAATPKKIRPAGPRTAPERPTAQPAISDYEKSRLENIRRNQEAIMQLGIQSLKTDLTKSLAPQRRAGPSQGRGPRTPQRHYSAHAAQQQSVVRKSRRIGGKAPDGKVREEGLKSEQSIMDSVMAKLWDPKEYFAEHNIKTGVEVNGHYSGWVSNEVRDRFGLAGNATDAWELNGGGKFSFKNPTGEKNGHMKISSLSSARGWSSAKAASAMLLHKNPNAYFYRHVAPGEEEWFGDWSEEERAIFIETAKKYGCGDKWGLFSTFLPHRVGYQCSNYYRQNIIPTGAVIDPNYRLTNAGEAIYAGSKGSSYRG